MFKNKRLRLLILLLASFTLSPVFANGQANSLGVSNGIYTAEGFGANYYFGARYAKFFNNAHYFVEGTVGISSLESRVLNELSAFQVFDSNRLMTYEFVFGYDKFPAGGMPFFVMGVAGLKQGGQSKFAYVLGIGKQIPLSQFFDVKRIAVRYDIRDHIFRQQINDNQRFTSHNLSFTLGLQYYF